MLNRPLLVGLIGVGLVAIGTGLAWLHLGQQEEAAPQTAAVSTAQPVPTSAAPRTPVAPSAILPSFDVVRINPQGDAVMAGRAAPNTQVQIFDGNKPIGTVTSDARGEWVFVPTDPLLPGGRELSLAARSGDTVTRSDQVVVLVVPERGKDVAAGTAPAAPLALAARRDGTGASTLLQGPARGEANAARLSVDVIDYDTAGKLMLAGRAPANTAVQVYIENKLVGRTRSNADGRWMLVPEDKVAPGLYTLRLDELATDGRVATRIELPFQRAEIEIADASQSSIVVQPGDSLWRIARRTHGQGMAYTVIYEANRDQIRDPDLIYPGQVFNLTRIH